MNPAIMTSPRRIRGLALLSCLASIISSVHLQDADCGDNEKITSGNCNISIRELNGPSPYHRGLDNLEPMQMLGQQVLVQPQNGTQQCLLDVDQIIDTVPENEIVLLYTNIYCVGDAKFQLILENRRSIQRMNAIGQLYTESCQIYWKHMALYGQSVDLRVLLVMDWKDKFEEELELFGTPPKFPAPYDTGLANVGTLHIVSSSAHVPFPRILKEYAWFKMGDIHFVRFSFGSIPDEWMTRMPQLQSMTLTNCGFSQPPSIFPWNSENLNLPKNMSRTLAVNYYLQNPEIQVEPYIYQYRRFLSLHLNIIPNLTDFQFSGYFQELDLQGNGLEVIGATTFQGIQHLTHLGLSFNLLTTLPQSVFHDLTELKHLSIENNLLKSLDPTTFHGLLSLKTLNLSNNRLTSLGAGCFSQLPSLQNLDVASNNLSFIDDDAVSVYSVPLIAVNLAGNQLTSIPTWLILVKSLLQVDISDNHITFDGVHSLLERLYNQDVISLGFLLLSNHNLKVIKLQRNNLTSIPLQELNLEERTYFFHFLSSFHLDVTENPINCDCNSFSFYQYLIEPQLSIPPRHINSWKCNSPKAVKNTPIVEVPAITFQCPQNLTDCPAKCTCYVRSVDKVVEVDCRNRSLTEIPERVPLQTEFLYMDKNGISQLSQVYPYFHNLTKLTLSYNNVSSISDSVVKALSNLTHLNLQNNRLQYLPKALKAMKLDSIALRSNPMVCDCHSKWVKYWLLSQRHSISDFEDVLCTAGKVEGQHFVEALDKDFVCEIPKGWKAAISMGVFTGVTTFAVVLVYRFRGEIKLFLYVHFNWHPFDNSDDEDCDKKYDAFVSYSGIDYRWVCHILRKKIELREPPYRLCLHDRDFMPGHPIQENIMKAIDESRRMIVILSKNYIQSDWCLYEFRAAHHKVMKERCNYLIVIKCSDVSMSDLDEDLQLYLRTNTYLDVTNKHFWEKLLYTLPQTPLSVLKNSESGQQRHESAAVPVYPAGLTSPLVVPVDATLEAGQSQQGHLNPVLASGLNQFDATIMQLNTACEQAFNQQTVVLLPCPQQAGGENGQLAAYMNLCTMWPVNGYVQAPSGEVLCQANGYMPYPGPSFLPDENCPAEYQESSDSESESAPGKDDDVQLPQLVSNDSTRILPITDSGNIISGIEMDFIDTEAENVHVSLPGLHVSLPKEARKEDTTVV